MIKIGAYLSIINSRSKIIALAINTFKTAFLVEFIYLGGQ